MSGETCLICDCSLGFLEGTHCLPVTFEFEPSVSSVLSENLGAYFILRHVLELPSEQLENYLRHCPNPGDWVKICQLCRRNYVEKCARIFLELLEVKRRFNDARLELIGVVKRSKDAESKVTSDELGGVGGRGQEPVILDICKETRGFVIQNEYRDCKINPFIDGDEKAREELHKQEAWLNIKLDILEKELKEEAHSQDEDEIESDEHISHLGQTVFSENDSNSNVDANDCGSVDRDLDWNVNICNLSSKTSEESDSSKPEDATSKKSKISVQRANSKSKKTTKTSTKKSISKSSQFTCDLCYTEFNSEKRLRLHQIRTHKTNYYTCSECNWKTDAACHLINHVNRLHPQKSKEAKGRFKCGLCPRTFFSENTIRGHQIRKHKINFYECSECDKKFLNNQSLLEHMKRYHGNEKDLEEFKCPTCHKLFSYKNNLIHHMTQNHNKLRRKFKCDHCEKEFCQKKTLYDHLGSKHGITDKLNYKCTFEGCGKCFYVKHELTEHEDVHKPPQYHCEICGASFQKKICFKMHVKYHRKLETMAYQCDHCPAKFARGDNLKKHIKVVHNPNTSISKIEYKWQGGKMVKCSKCGVLFGRRSGLRRHLEKMHPELENIENENKPVYKCSRCDFTSTSRYQFRRHKKLYHNNVNDTEMGQRFMPNTKVKCSKCEKILFSQYHLKLHMSRCQGNGKRKMFKCEQCGKDFFWKKVLHTHLGAVHGIKDFLRVTCDFEGCGKSFYMQSQLKRHNEIAHGSQEERKKFLCHLCPAKFILKQSLKWHMNTKHIEESILDGESGKGKTFKCHICGKILAKKWNLKMHIDAVHEAKKNESVCDICGKVIKSKYYLEVHKSNVHKIGNVQIKKYPCEVKGCSKTFCSKAEMKRHILFVHEGRRNHQCNICGKRVASENSLRRHVEVMHSENRESKPWKCEECGKGFAVKGYLWLHMKTHQPKDAEKKVEQL